MQDAADLGNSPCARPAPHGTLALFEAIRYALCSDPKTRQEWSALQVQAARLGQAKAAFWPKLDASVQASRDHSITKVSGQPMFNSDRSSTYQQQMLSMSWTLYDFGARSAQARAAQELLTASHYALDDALQSAVLRVATDYGKAQAALAAWALARRTVRTSQTDAEVAQGRMNHGVAPLSDVLQTQTALAQAQADAQRARDAAHGALGELAIDMGVTPGTARFSVLPLQALPDASSLSHERLRRLLDRAELTNPRIRADQAQYLSALAHAEAVRDQGLPTLKLAWQYSHSTQPVIEGLGLPAFGAATRDNNVALEVQIPLFDGWAQRDREHRSSTPSAPSSCFC